MHRISKVFMKVVILNWSEGENDPFSVFNNTLKKYVKEAGKNPVIMDINEPNLYEKLIEIKKMEGIEFVITWQGIGSSQTLENGEYFWKTFKVPLICLHGDHPSHCPRNHVHESNYCIHMYLDSEFACYSNNHFRRLFGAHCINMPVVYLEDSPREVLGDYFVFPKNITRPAIMEQSWKLNLDEKLYHFCMDVAGILKEKIHQQSYLDFHSLIDRLIIEFNFLELLEGTYSQFYHYVHSQLDFYVRNYRSVTLVKELSDVPIKIFGRGWDEIKEKGSKNHQFFNGLQSRDSGQLFYSKYGLLDISPSRCLHDRTLRAIANKTSFLCSANMDHVIPDAASFQDIFFTFQPEDIIKKCEKVMKDPFKHLQLCQAFGKTYQMLFRPFEFVNHLSSLARQASYTD